MKLRTRSGLVKLRQPRAGYAYVSMDGWDPRTVGNITIDLSDYRARLPNGYETSKGVRIFASLEEAAEGRILGSSVEDVTKAVTQALDFVETGQPPEPKRIKPLYEYNDW